MNRYGSILEKCWGHLPSNIQISVGEVKEMWVDGEKRGYVGDVSEMIYRDMTVLGMVEVGAR